MFRRRLPEGPVKMPTSYRMTFMQAALLVSFLMHAVGLFGWSLSPPLSAASEEIGARSYVVEVVPYRERAPVATEAPPPAAAPPPSPSGPRVGYVEGYIGKVKKPEHFPDDRAPEQQPRRRTEPVIHDVPAPPPPNRQDQAAPQATPSPVASSDPPPPPSPTPTPQAAATPTPVPTPLVAATPSPSPALPVSVQDPRADFSLILRYENDSRLKRNADGSLSADLGYLSGLTDLKPVLANGVRATVPLRDAGRFGLRPMSLVRGTVKVSIDLDKKAISPLVMPSHVRIVDLTVDGKTVQGAQRDQLVLFIQDGVSSTQWFPASSKGIWADHSEQTFEVEVIQVSDDTAMSPPTSRAP